MTRRTSLRPVFVQYVPDTAEEGVLYVSIDNRTAIHKCCCGCGNEVVTPLDPTQWKLIYDGRVSLDPSVGSWNLACRSHYWIQQNAVLWAERWSDTRVAAARATQRQRTGQYYSAGSPQPSPKTEVDSASRAGLWQRFWTWFTR